MGVLPRRALFCPLLFEVKLLTGWFLPPQTPVACSSFSLQGASHKLHAQPLAPLYLGTEIKSLSFWPFFFLFALTSSARARSSSSLLLFFSGRAGPKHRGCRTVFPEAASGALAGSADACCVCGFGVAFEAITCLGFLQELSGLSFPLQKFPLTKVLEAETCAC